MGEALKSYNPCNKVLRAAPRKGIMIGFSVWPKNMKWNRPSVREGDPVNSLLTNEKMPVPFSLMNNVMRFSLILIGSVLLLLVGGRAQTKDAPKWYTTGPESDFKDSMVYQAQSDFGGKHYSSTIYGRDLEDVVKWKEGKRFAYQHVEN